MMTWNTITEWGSLITTGIMGSWRTTDLGQQTATQKISMLNLMGSMVSTVRIADSEITAKCY